MSDPRRGDLVFAGFDQSCGCVLDGPVLLHRVDDCRREHGAVLCPAEGSAPETPVEHPPLHPDEHGDWAAANSGIGLQLLVVRRVAAYVRGFTVPPPVMRGPDSARSEWQLLQDVAASIEAHEQALIAGAVPVSPRSAPPDAP